MSIRRGGEKPFVRNKWLYMSNIFYVIYHHNFIVTFEQNDKKKKKLQIFTWYIIID